MWLSMLREYQTKSIELIKKEFQSGNRRTCLHLATGAGKTVIFSEILKRTAILGKKCLVITRGRKLVQQASDRLFRESVEHGTLLAGHWNYKLNRNVLVCSIDTLLARGIKPDADLIIIDEAHLFTKSSKAGKFLSQYPSAFVLSVTATPWATGGLKHITNSVIQPISMNGLILEGYLVPFRIFAPSTPDLKEVKVSPSTKDYVNNQLETAMVKGSLTGNIVENWKKVASDRKTIVFAVNIHHSKIIVENFKVSGIKAEHCDADSTDEERNEIIKKLERGEISIVSNVGIWTTGVDLPFVDCIVMARPTQSRNLYIQSVGRGTRIFDGKKDCLVLDHAGNVHRHGLPTHEPNVNLEGKQTISTIRESKTCKECFCVFIGSRCPECGKEIEISVKIKKQILETEEQLKEITESPVVIIHNMLLKEQKETGKHIGWVYHKLVNRFGWDEVRHLLPNWFVSRYEYQQKELFKTSPYAPLLK